MDDRDRVFADARVEHRPPARVWRLFRGTASGVQRQRQLNFVDRSDSRRYVQSVALGKERQRRQLTSL